MTLTPPPLSRQRECGMTLTPHPSPAGRRGA